MEDSDSDSNKSLVAANFEGLRVAALESRRSDDMHRLIERFNGVPSVCPSMREVPLKESRETVDFAYRLMTGEINIVIFLTGVGFKHVLNVVEKHIDKQRFLDALSDVTTIARGPKPTAAMREHGLQPTHRVPEPNTWRELLDLLDEKVPLANQVVGLQEYGVTNQALVAGLEARGARVVHVRVYQWDFPEDSEPLKKNLVAMANGERDVLLFTSAHQAVNLMRLAATENLEQPLRAAFEKMIVASIGPTTSDMLQQLEIPIHLEPDHPKMGKLVQAAAEKSKRLLDARRLLVSLKAQTTKESKALHQASYDSPMMRACRRQAADVTPVWLMRQAGRYMKEYRDVRSKMSFLELCKNPSLCAEVMVTAVEKLNVDAAIIFSDLLPILEPMGFDLEFAKGDGPVIHNPLRAAGDVDRVTELADMESLDFVMQTVTMTRRAIRPEIPVIGFSGAPFTLASYMIEGGGSKNYLHTKRLMFGDSGAWHTLMVKLTNSIARYLNAQIAAGAQIVQIFDSWVGCLSPGMYRTFVAPYMQILLDAIVPETPVINFGTGNPLLLPLQRGDARTVVGIDWRVDLNHGWEMAGHDRAVQGNLDPTVLFADTHAIRREVSKILDQSEQRSGHIFNLGHGILPETPVDHAVALVDMVHELSQR